MRYTCAVLALLIAALFAAPASALPPECKLASHVRIPDGNQATFSPDGQRIGYDWEDPQGYYQAVVSNPDGTGRVNLAQGGVNAPAANRHKSGLTWRSQGDFIAMSVERTDHLLRWMSNSSLFRHLAMNGVSAEVWVTTPTGDQWWKVYSPAGVGSLNTSGVMGVSFSPDGTKIGWSRLVKPAQDGVIPWGAYTIEIADFVVEDGVPAVRNVRDITPAGGNLVEFGAFNRDATKVVVGADMATNQQTNKNLEIYEIDVATAAARRVTNNTVWDEHPSYVRDFERITHLSGGEMNQTALDGTTEVLTKFNSWWNPEWRDPSAEWPVIPTTSEWSPDGTKLAATVQSVWRYPKAWLDTVTFVGSCGG